MKMLWRMDPMLKTRQSACGINTVALDLFAFLIYTRGKNPAPPQGQSRGKILTRPNLFSSFIISW